MKKHFKKTSIALTIVMMFIPAIFGGEGYTKSQQQKFINDAKKVWEGAIQYEPYRSYADRFNVYALCTASESSFNNSGSTFFDVVIDKKV